MRSRKPPASSPAGRWSTSRPANSQQEAHHDHPAHRFQPPRPARLARRHRRIRTAAAIAAVAALIATGGYLATTTIGPDATPPTPATGTDVNPSAQTLRDCARASPASTAANAAADATVNPNAQVRRELRESIAGQYGPAR